MKYIISESRLNTLIQDFITNSIGGELTKYYHPSSAVGYMWWKNSNGDTIFESDDSDEDWALGVRGDLWDLVRGMFLLDAYATDKSFLTWMENYSGMKFPAGVYTFEY